MDYKTYNLYISLVMIRHRTAFQTVSFPFDCLALSATHIPNSFPALIPLILITTRRYRYYLLLLHFNDEKTEVQRG